MYITLSSIDLHYQDSLLSLLSCSLCFVLLVLFVVEAPVFVLNPRIIYTTMPDVHIKNKWRKIRTTLALVHINPLRNKSPLMIFLYHNLSSQTNSINKKGFLPLDHGESSIWIPCGYYWRCIQYAFCWIKNKKQNIENVVKPGKQIIKMTKEEVEAFIERGKLFSKHLMTQIPPRKVPSLFRSMSHMKDHVKGKWLHLLPLHPPLLTAQSFFAPSTESSVSLSSTNQVSATPAISNSSVSVKPRSFTSSRASIPIAVYGNGDSKYVSCVRT